ncbi:hypothetical protein YSA_01690 [Pseudomonas putida ND6]|uniref:Uncharacterized protein n=1 Tax=Pseudomonas putida ND6 TaxID=231023 RepID=I3UQC4_PSEPU|nr:hypothetical protein YSA_01690 [Pseudomonas putida ND6]
MPKIYGIRNGNFKNTFGLLRVITVLIPTRKQERCA